MIYKFRFTLRGLDVAVQRLYYARFFYRTYF
jgi:hypothetical protein